MNHPVLINDRITVWREGPTQGNVRVELPILVEVDDAQGFRLTHAAARGLEFTFQEPQQRRLPAAIWTDEPHAHAGGDDEMNIAKERAIAQGITHVIKGD